MLLLCISLYASAMEKSPDIKISIDRAETPEPGYTPEEIRRVIDAEFEFMDQSFQERIKALDGKLEAQRVDIESHKQDTRQGIQNTRIALAATTITTLGGIVTALITFFTTKYVHDGSN